MDKEEKELTITYLTEMQEEYIEGEGYERHPLPEYYALDMAIKALEQPTSDDSVSRTDLLKIYENRFIELQKAHQTDKQLGVNWCINTLKDMPPITPTRKVGKWIEVWESQRDDFSGEYDEWREHKCSICGFQELDADRFNFCPNCGAEMKGDSNGTCQEMST